jgi:hypothetical protein
MSYPLWQANPMQQKDTVYRTYSNSIIRKPFPVGQIDEEAP